MANQVASVGKTRPTSVYAAVGATVTNYVIDVEAGTLTAAGSIRMPTRVQFAWAHASLPILYVACADRGSEGGDQPFLLCALWRDDNGDLSMHGNPVALPARAIHTTTDVDSRHALTIYGGEPGLTVHEIHEDGTIGAELTRAENFDPGIGLHQVRMMPDNQAAVLVSRGAKGFGTPKYVPGALKLVGFADGVIRNLDSMTPDQAFTPTGFNPRDIDFDPNHPRVFAILEAQNLLAVFPISDGGIGSEPTFVGNFLQHPETLRKRQDGGPLHIHPNGRYAYVGNRNDGYVGGQTGPSWLIPDPLPEFPGGENSIAVFEVDAETGLPRLVQHVDTQGLAPRTFALDDSGKILIAGNISPTAIREGEDLKHVPASLAVFSVGEDGRLTFLRKYDLDTGREKLWWTGIVG